MNGITWPDGQALLFQPVKLFYAFNTIGMVHQLVNKNKGKAE